MQNGSLKIGVVQNYIFSPILPATIYQLQVDILKTFNELSNSDLLSIFTFARNATVVLAPRQSGMGPTVFQESEKGPEKEILLLLPLAQPLWYIIYTPLL